MGYLIFGVYVLAGLALLVAIARSDSDLSYALENLACALLVVLLWPMFIVFEALAVVVKVARGSRR